MILAREFNAAAMFLRSFSVIFVETLCMVPDRRDVPLREPANASGKFGLNVNQSFELKINRQG
jgi:hypothetical protein